MCFALYAFSDGLKIRLDSFREDIKKKTADLVKIALLGGGGQKNY